MPEPTEADPFWDFIGGLTERIRSSAGGRLPPMPLLARAWALCSQGDLVYAEALRTQLRDPDGTRWELVLADGTHLVHVAGETTATEWWDYDEQMRMSANERLAQDGEATIGATRRRLADIGAIDASGSAPEWLAITGSPPRPTWTLTWEDGHQVTIPLSPTPSASIIEGAKRVVDHSDARP